MALGQSTATWSYRRQFKQYLTKSAGTGRCGGWGGSAWCQADTIACNEQPASIPPHQVENGVAEEKIGDRRKPCGGRLP
jgi:hypothetical protein